MLECFTKLSIMIFSRISYSFNIIEPINSCLREWLHLIKMY